MGYQEDTFTLKPGAGFPVSPSGSRLAELQSTSSGRIVCSPMPGVTVNNSPKPVRVVHGSQIDLASEEHVYNYRLEIVPRRPAVAASKSTNTQEGGYY